MVLLCCEEMTGFDIEASDLSVRSREGAPALHLRPFFKSLFVYRVFLRFESQLSTKGNRQIPERNERTFGKRSNWVILLFSLHFLNLIIMS